jgi:hypothetical protein
MDRQRRHYMLPLCIVLSFSPIFSHAQSAGEAGWPERQKTWLGMIDEKSMAYNRDGYTAYTKKDYEAAVTAFESAIKKDPDNCFAHYNLACTLSLLYGQGKRGMDVMDKIVQHLTKAGKLDSHWLERIFVDTDFNPLRKKGIKTSDSIPGPVDSRLTFEFSQDGKTGCMRSYDDLVGGPIEGETAQPAQKPPAPTLDGRYIILGDRVLVIIPGLDSTLAFFSGMGPMYGEENPPVETYAGSPGMDFTWFSAVLNSNGNVKEISVFGR